MLIPMQAGWYSTAEDCAMTEQTANGEHTLNGLLALVARQAPELSSDHRHRIERYLGMAVRILERLNVTGTSAGLIEETVEIIKGTTGLEEVKIHPLTGGDAREHRLMGVCVALTDIDESPDQVRRSTSECRVSGSRPCLECMFATVVSGRTDKSLPYFTPGGSFWINSRGDLQSAVSIVDPTRELERDGCESVALIPLRSGKTTEALLELRDSKPDRLSRELVLCLEGVGESLAAALDRLRAGGRLRESEAHYRALFERSTSPILVVDSEGNYLDCNQAASQFLGCGRNELLEKNLKDFAPPGKEEEAFEKQIALAGNDELMEVDYFVKGVRKTLELAVTPMIWRGRQIVFQVGKDITDRKEVERALRDSEKHLKEARRIGELGDWEYDPETLRMFWSDELFRLFRRNREDGQPTFDETLAYCVPEDAVRLREHFKRALRDGEEIDADYQVRFPDGELAYERCLISPVKDPEGNVVRLRGTIQDVTERRKAEDGLRWAEEKYRELVENLNETIYAVDESGVATYTSPAIKTLLGYDPQEVVGQPFSRFIYEDDLARCAEDFKKTLSGEAVKGEYRIVTKSGDLRCIQASNRPIVASGRVAGARGVITDITDAKLAESRLRESEENYRTIVELAPDGIITIDLEGRITSCNTAFLQLYGHREEEIVGKHFTELPAVRPEDTPKYTATFAALLRGECPSEMEIAWRSLNGQTKYADIRSTLVMKDGRVVGIQCVARDITEHKIAEQELRRSESQYRNLVESMNDGLAIQNDEGLVAYANDRFCEMLGFHRDEVIGRPLASLMDEENLQIVNEQTAKRKNGKRSSYELSWKKKDGRVVNTLTSGSPITDPNGHLVGSFGVITDITERKHAERALRESEEKLRTVFESVVDGIVVLDLKGRIIELNEALVKMFGYDHKAEALGRSAFDFMQEREKNRAFKELGRVYKRGPVTGAEYTCVRRDGECFPTEISASVLKGSSGKPSGFVAVVEDITERKKAEEEVRKFKTISDRAGYGVVVTDLSGRISYVNDAFAEMLGYWSEELISAHASILYDDDHAKEMERLLELLEREGKYVGEEVWPKRKDGTTFPATMNATLITKSSGEPLLMAATCVDITERKRAQDEREKAEGQLRQSQKMEALGTLAGGVAHDFNNLLTAIRGYTDLALMKMPKDDFISPYLCHIRDASTRAAKLTNQLLMFSKRHAVDYRRLDLNKVISNLLKMLNRLIGEKYSIVTDLSPELWRVNGDSGHLEQVLMNIVVNAKDAMPGGGQIHISTENDDSPAVPGSENGGLSVCLTVRDSGVGMDETTLSRIFEPFYSTKSAGKGTGIGLAVVYGIVEGHGGRINVESKPKEGSTFRIYFPAVLEEADGDEEEPGSFEGLSGMGEKILVVEDEDDVRGLAEGVLDENGYTVFLARSGEEAFEVFRREGGNLDLVFSDVILPDRSGIEVVEQLLAQKPGLPVLLASGYGQEDSNYEAIRDKGYPFLQKPYQLTDLLKTIKRILVRE
jgi:PAS domain S-box-containing protein